MPPPGDAGGAQGGRDRASAVFTDMSAVWKHSQLRIAWALEEDPNTPLADPHPNIARRIVALARKRFEGQLFSFSTFMRHYSYHLPEIMPPENPMLMLKLNLPPGYVLRRTFGRNRPQSLQETAAIVIESLRRSGLWEVVVRNDQVVFLPRKPTGT